jgi:hypothetical protein
MTLSKMDHLSSMTIMFAYIYIVLADLHWVEPPLDDTISEDDVVDGD